MGECIICGEETDKGGKNFATGDWIYLCCRDCDDEYNHQRWRSETFHSVAVSRERPKKITERVMQQQLLLTQAELAYLDVRLDADVRLGRITPEQAERIMMKAASKVGLAAEYLGDDVDWDRENPPVGDWADEVDWTVVQAAQAYDYLMALAEGGEGTEFESNFLLDEYYMSLLRARLGSQMEGIRDMEGFGEGPYPVPIAILTPDEICTQTELQLHTIFEAYESVMEGLPDHDDDDHDHDDDDDHDEFETIINLYSPYRDATYEVLVRTAEGNLIEGPFTDLVVAQEVVDDWNAPGYETRATLRRRPHQNGAYRGLSRVVFEDGSYLTFLLLGDLTQRQGDYINMTSVFLFPRAHSADSGWWESHSNN